MRPLASFRSRWYSGLLLVVAIALALLVAELANRRFSMVDFGVFHAAGSRVLRGENLYRPLEDGFYEWKYAPPAALLFAPFGLLPMLAAKVAWWILLAGVFAANLWMSLRLALPGYRSVPAKANRVVLIAALAVAVHLHLELHLGQVNQVILALFLIMGTALAGGRPVLFGAAFAASFALKPFAAILVPWLVVRRRWMALGAAAAMTLLFAAAPLVTYSPAELAHQYAGWRAELGEELAKKADLLAPANHTLASVVSRYTPVRAVAERPGAARAIPLATILLLGLGILWFVRRGEGVERRDAAELALLLLCVPLIAFTNYNAFGAALLAAVVLLARWEVFSPPWKAVIVAGLVLLGGNVHDLWGKRLFGVLNGLSLVAIAAVLLGAALARGRAAKAL